MTAVSFTLPDDLYSAASITMRPITVSQMSRGALTPVFRTRGVLSTYWIAEISFNPMYADKKRRLEAFIGRLDGQRNHVLLHDKARERPLGKGFGAKTNYDWEYSGTTYPWEYNSRTYPWQSGLINAVPVAVTASKGSDKLTIEGLTPSTVEAVAPGDVFSIGTNLYMAVTAANTDANGQASITIRPRLRKTAFKGETARFDKPTGRFSLSSSEAFSSAFNADGFAGNTATLSLIEVPDLGEAS